MNRITIDLPESVSQIKIRLTTQNAHGSPLFYDDFSVENVDGLYIEHGEEPHARKISFTGTRLHQNNGVYLRVKLRELVSQMQQILDKNNGTCSKEETEKYDALLDQASQVIAENKRMFVRYIPLSDVMNICMDYVPDDDGSVGETGDMREMLDQIEAIPSVTLGQLSEMR